MRGGASLAAAFLLLLPGCLVTEDELSGDAIAGLAASFEQEAGRVVLPQVLDDDTCLVLQGDAHVVGATAARPTASGASLAVIVRHGSLLVDAAVAAGTGEPGPHLADDGDVLGGAGDDGGSVVFLAPEGLVELRNGGVQAGNGGHGGSARSEGGSARGGDGGDGGSLVAGGRGVTRGLFEVVLGSGAPGGSGTVVRGGVEDAGSAGDAGQAGRDATLEAPQALELAQALQADCSDIALALGQVLGGAANAADAGRGEDADADGA